MECNKSFVRFCMTFLCIYHNIIFFNILVSKACFKKVSIGDKLLLEVRFFRREFPHDIHYLCVHIFPFFVLKNVSFICFWANNDITFSKFLLTKSILYKPYRIFSDAVSKYADQVNHFLIFFKILPVGIKCCLFLYFPYINRKQ